MKRVLFVFIVLYSQFSFSSTILTCRLDDTLVDEVRDSIENTLMAFGSIDIDISFEQILVNPKILNNNALNVLLIRDARKSELDKDGCFISTPYLGHYVSNSDRYSIAKSICIAKSFNEIHCSADALARVVLEDGESLNQSYEYYEFMSRQPETEEMADYIIGIEPSLRKNENLFLAEIAKKFGKEKANQHKRVILEGVTLQRSILRNHPALFYMFAHELAHIVRGDVGQFNSVSSWDLSRGFKKKFTDFQTKICGLQGNSIEMAADEIAIKAMVFGFNDYPYSGQNLFSHINNIRLTINKLLNWGSNSGEPILDAMNSASLPMTNENATKLANQIRCTLFETKNVVIKIPIISGTHPAAPLRMKEIAKTLSKQANNPPNPNSPFGQLFNDAGNVLGVLDESYGDAFKMVGDEICKKQGKALKVSLQQCNY